MPDGRPTGIRDTSIAPHDAISVPRDVVLLAVQQNQLDVPGFLIDLPAGQHVAGLLPHHPALHLRRDVPGGRDDRFDDLLPLAVRPITERSGPNGIVEKPVPSTPPRPSATWQLLHAEFDEKNTRRPASTSPPLASSFCQPSTPSGRPDSEPRTNSSWFTSFAPAASPRMA